MPPLKPSDLWLTPPWLLDLVREVDDIALDPCPGPAGWVRATSELRLDKGDDGLATDWYAHWAEDLRRLGLVFVNPPYGPGHLPLWAPKILSEAERGAAEGMEIVALLPATPSPEWFHLLAPKADAICFLAGRPKFWSPETLEESCGPGTKDSAVFYFGERARRFRRVFQPKGWVVTR